MKLPALLVIAAGLLVAADTKDDAIKKDKAKLKGSWSIVAIEEEGKKQALPEGIKASLVFQDDKLATTGVRGDKKDSREATYVIDPTKKPATIDITLLDGPERGKTVPGIYAFEKDELKICWALKSDQDRPKEFPTKAGSKSILFTLKREKQ